MKIIALILMLFALRSQAALTLTNGSTVVVYGDSYTFASMWSHYFASYYIMRNPTKVLHFYSEGKNGAALTVPGLVRYTINVEPYKPYDYVLVLMTLNATTSSNDFRVNLQNFGNDIVGDGAVPILMGVEPVNTSNGEAAGETSKYQDRNTIHQELGVLNSWPHVDLMSYLLVPYSNNFAAGSPIDLGWPNSSHPGSAGYLNIAWAELEGLGEDGLVSGAAIDADAETVTLQTNCTISSLVASTTNVSFTRLDTRLPMCWDASASNAIVMFPAIITNMNRMPLIVSNLDAGTYSVSIDGVTVSNAMHTQLALGINLAELTTGSYWTQRVDVLGCLRDQQGINRTTLVTNNPASGIYKYQLACDLEYGNGLRGAALAAAVADEKAEVFALDEATNDAAQPIARSFVIALQSEGEEVEPPGVGKASATGNVGASGNVGFQ